MAIITNFEVFLVTMAVLLGVFMVCLMFYIVYDSMTEMKESRTHKSRTRNTAEILEQLLHDNLGGTNSQDPSSPPISPDPRISEPNSNKIEMEKID